MMLGEEPGQQKPRSSRARNYPDAVPEDRCDRPNCFIELR
jgi:hypothetical protein